MKKAVLLGDECTYLKLAPEKLTSSSEAHFRLAPSKVALSPPLSSKLAPRRIVPSKLAPFKLAPLIINEYSVVVTIVAT